MSAARCCLAALTAFGGGLMAACGVFAFVAAVGIVPRLAYKTGTFARVRLYEEAIVAGGVFGCGTLITDYRLGLGPVAAGAAGLLTGVFFGCMAVCLAEVLYVMPVLSRRTGLVKGLRHLLTAFAFGKLAGALVYFFVPGFM